MSRVGFVDRIFWHREVLCSTHFCSIGPKYVFAFRKYRIKYGHNLVAREEKKLQKLEKRYTENQEALRTGVRDRVQGF